MTILDNPATLTADEILEKYASNENRWTGWDDHHIDFEVGYATAELHSSYQGFRTVYSVHTHVDHRGQGHGRRLMEVIVAYAETKGYGLNLTVLVDNEPAVRLYESVGFTITWTREAGVNAFGSPTPAMHGMKRYPTVIPDTKEWAAHFAAEAKHLAEEAEPAPEGPDEWDAPRKAIRAAEEAASKAVEHRNRYSTSKRYMENSYRLYRDAFGAALLESGWTITRTQED